METNDRISADLVKKVREMYNAGNNSLHNMTAELEILNKVIEVIEEIKIDAKIYSKELVDKGLSSFPQYEGFLNKPNSQDALSSAIWNLEKFYHVNEHKAPWGNTFNDTERYDALVKCIKEGGDEAKIIEDYLQQRVDERAVILESISKEKEVYLRRIDDATQEIKDSLKDDGIDIGAEENRYIRRALDAFKTNAVNLFTKNFDSDHPSLVDEEKFLEYLNAYKDSSLWALADEGTRTMMRDIFNQSPFAKKHPKEANRPWVKNYLDELYGGPKGMNPSDYSSEPSELGIYPLEKESTFKTVSAMMARAAGADSEVEYKNFVQILEDKFTSTKYFDLSDTSFLHTFREDAIDAVDAVDKLGGSVKNIDGQVHLGVDTSRLEDAENTIEHTGKKWQPIGMLASAGASDVLPLKANPDMIQQMNLTGEATIDITPAMEANEVLRAAIANPILLPEMDGRFAEKIGEDFLSALFASPMENPEELTPYALDMLNTIFSGFSLENFEGAENIGEALHQGIAGGIDNAVEALQDEDFLSSLGVVQGMMSDAMIGIAPSQEDLARFDEAWAYITDGQSSFMESMMALSGGNAEAADGMLQSFLGLDGLDLSGLEDAKAQMLAFAESFKGIDTDFDYAAASAEALNQRGIDMTQTFGAAKAAFLQSSVALGTLTKGQQALEKAQKGVIALSKEEQADLDAAKKLLGYKAEGYEGLGDAIDEGIKKESMSIEKSIALMKKAHGELGETIKNAEKDPNYSRVDLENLKAKHAEDEDFLDKLEAAKKKNDARRRAARKAAEAAARAQAAEQARKEAIQNDYQMIAHKRHMNEITLEEELAMLEKIREQRKLNAEETMQWEEKVYDLKKEINARDSGSIDKMGSGVVTALSNRYQAMLDAETERLDTSREAWKTWRDDSVKAIEDQIAALDELSKTEDREKQDQEELRKIAKLRQDIEFEQDEYNRAKLQQQLEQAIESREERLKKQERDDQKDALREEIKGINERADAERAVRACKRGLCPPSPKRYAFLASPCAGHSWVRGLK